MSDHPFAAMLHRMQKPPEAPKALPMMEAQQDHLRHVLGLVAAEPRKTFVRGDFVRYLHSTGPVEKSVHLALMFWRWLDESTDDRRRIETIDQAYLLSLSHLDCLLIAFDGNDTIFLVGGSEFLTIDDRVRRFEEPLS